MRANLITAIMALGLLGGLMDEVRAQQRTFSSSGSSLGGTLSYGGSSAFGSSSMGGMGGTGSSMGGMGGMNSSGSFGSNNSSGSTSTGSFMSNVRPTGSFVGGNAQSAQAIAQQVGGSQQGSTGMGANGMGMGGNANASRRNLMTQMRGGQNATGTQSMGNTTNAVTPIRASLREAFDHPHLSAPDVNESLSRRLRNTPAVTARSLEVTIQDQTVVLRGEVSTEHGRLLAEQLARLEPGIWKVRNELTVGKAGTSASPSDGQPKPLPPALKLELRNLNPND